MLVCKILFILLIFNLQHSLLLKSVAALFNETAPEILPLK